MYKNLRKGKKVATKIVITDEIISQAEQLASKGYSTQLIASSLGIGYSTAKSNNEALKVAIKKGRDEARCTIVDKLLARADESDTALIFLCKNLKVFEDSYITATPKTIDEATQRIADIYGAVSSNELDKDKGDKLVSYLEKYIKAYELSELEKRIEKIERLYNESK